MAGPVPVFGRAAFDPLRPMVCGTDDPVPVFAQARGGGRPFPAGGSGDDPGGGVIRPGGLRP